MRLEQLSARTESGKAMEWCFERDLTVIEVDESARMAVADVVALGLGLGADGLHMTVRLDSGRRVRAFRAGGGQHVLVDVETGEDLSADRCASDGRVRLLPGEGTTDGQELIVGWSESATPEVTESAQAFERAVRWHGRLRLVTLVLGPTMPLVGVAAIGSIGAGGTLSLIGASLALTAAMFAHDRRVTRAHKRAQDARDRARFGLAQIARHARLGRRPGGEVLPLLVNHRTQPDEAGDAGLLLDELRRLGEERQVVLLTSDRRMLDAAQPHPRVAPPIRDDVEPGPEASNGSAATPAGQVDEVDECDDSDELDEADEAQVLLLPN